MKNSEKNTLISYENKIIKGQSVALSQVLTFEGYDDIYFVEESSDNCQTQKNIKFDLGRKRIISCSNDCYLVFASEDKISIHKIDNLKTPIINITDYLKELGTLSKTVSCSLSSIKSRDGMFSSKGYYLQDCWDKEGLSYACDLVLLDGQLLIGNKSVCYFSLSHSNMIDIDIKSHMINEIEYVLSKKVVISKQEFEAILDKGGIKGAYPFISRKEYD